MIRPSYFIEELRRRKVNFFTGVPDSLLKNMCAYITDTTDKMNHIIAANEGNAVGLATGYHLATNKVPMVYMQNSGLGNTVNPILSLVDKEVYKIPLLLVIGWRGEPGVKDEPQHIKQGRTTLPLLDTMEVKYKVLSDDEAIVSKQIEEVLEFITIHNEPFALIIQKGTFDKYELVDRPINNFLLEREGSIRSVLSTIPTNSIVVSTTGKISRELFEVREEFGQPHNKDFLTVGSMGHANQIALGIALQRPERKVYCFDGDGAILMHTGSMAIIGDLSPQNYIHIVFNNGAHESVGAQPTVALNTELTKIAEACQYKYVFSVSTKEGLVDVMHRIKNMDGPIFLEVKVGLGAREDLGRPTSTPVGNKEALMDYLNVNK